MAYSGISTLLLCIISFTGMSTALAKNKVTSENIFSHLIDLQAVPECSCPFKWTSVTPTSIGTSNLQHASTMTFSIPSVIPSTAKEVLINVGVFSGTSNNGPYQDIKVYTQIGSARYEKYLLLYSWNQNAFNTNSDNMWFPMPPSRNVHLTVPAAYGPNAGARLFAIGYRSLA